MDSRGWSRRDSDVMIVGGDGNVAVAIVESALSEGSERGKAGTPRRVLFLLNGQSP